MEHTDDAQLAKEIAKDHLEEHDDYYDRLKEMEKEADLFQSDQGESVTVTDIGVYNVTVVADRPGEIKGHMVFVSDGGMVLYDYGSSILDPSTRILAPGGGYIHESSILGASYLDAINQDSFLKQDSHRALNQSEEELFNSLMESSYPVGTSADNPAGLFDKVRSFF